MKQFFWTIGGVCAAAAGFLVWKNNRVRPLHLLADETAEEALDTRTRAQPHPL